MVLHVLAGRHLCLGPQRGARSKPPKAADFFGRYCAFRTDVFLQVKHVDKHYVKLDIFISRSKMVQMCPKTAHFNATHELFRFLRIGWPPSIIEVRDSPNGIFGPWAWWVRGLARWESSWDAAVAAAAVSRKSRISNVVILSFTTKSGAPDHIIRSVSSSQYDATNFQIISWHFRAKNKCSY